MEESLCPPNGVFTPPPPVVISEPSNVSFEEVLHPELVQEMLELELAELAEAEAAIDDAEEEELWSLTMASQLKHLKVWGGSMLACLSTGEGEKGVLEGPAVTDPGGGGVAEALCDDYLLIPVSVCLGSRGCHTGTNCRYIPLLCTACAEALWC